MMYFFVLVILPDGWKATEHASSLKHFIISIKWFEYCLLILTFPIISGYIYFWIQNIVSYLFDGKTKSENILDIKNKNN